MSKTPQVEELANNILKALDGRSMKLLEKRSGIPYSTLRSHLLYNTSRLTAENVFAIAEALDLSPADLMPAKAAL